MKINEIFHSISGEGVHAGIPTIFVRLTGCNLRCSYCDTSYAWEGEEEMSVDQITGKVRNFRSTGWVLITGGDPLYQSEGVGALVDVLKHEEYKIEVEENGSFDPPGWFRLVDSWSVDVKCPSSGSSYGSFRRKWLTKMRKQDQLKFVVGTVGDLDFVRGFLNNARLRPTILVSPAAGTLVDEKKGIIEEYWNREWLQEVAEFCKEVNVRYSLQVHKVVYGSQKGV